VAVENDRYVVGCPAVVALASGVAVGDGHTLDGVVAALCLAANILILLMLWCARHHIAHARWDWKGLDMPN